jgi:hypothetical protein
MLGGVHLGTMDERIGMMSKSAAVRTDGGSWVRYGDGMMSDGGGEYCFIVGPDDCSRSTKSSEYRESCGLCWLGTPHSLDLHNVRG